MHSFVNFMRIVLKVFVRIAAKNACHLTVAKCKDCIAFEDWILKNYLWKKFYPPKYNHIWNQFYVNDVEMIVRSWSPRDIYNDWNLIKAQFSIKIFRLLQNKFEDRFSIECFCFWFVFLKKSAFYMAFEFPFMCNERKCALLRNFIDKKCPIFSISDFWRTNLKISVPKAKKSLALTKRDRTRDLPKRNKWRHSMRHCWNLKIPPEWKLSACLCKNRRKNRTRIITKWLTILWTWKPSKAAWGAGFTRTSRILSKVSLFLLALLAF